MRQTRYRTQSSPGRLLLTKNGAFLATVDVYQLHPESGEVLNIFC
jgi:hypothetical protein